MIEELQVGAQMAVSTMTRASSTAKAASASPTRPANAWAA
jgi:hypothetical protein